LSFPIIPRLTAAIGENAGDPKTFPMTSKGWGWVK